MVLDGDSGQVIVSPDPTATAEAEERRRLSLALESSMVGAAHPPAVTADGTEIILRANIEFPTEVERAIAFGAQGIGLYRSEFLFLSRAPAMPDDEDHARTYAEICAKMEPEPVVIRTFDLGGEKYSHNVMQSEDVHPVLGLRGIRLCLRRHDIFLPQLRGLLRVAAIHDNLRIMLPLVTSVEEIREVRTLIEREAVSLRAEASRGCCLPDPWPQPVAPKSRCKLTWSCWRRPDPSWTSMASHLPSTLLPDSASGKSQAKR